MKKKKLRKIAPILSRVSKMDNAFGLPDGYFDTLEDSVLSSIYENKLIKGPRVSPFQTPDNYFANFENNLLLNKDSELPESMKLGKVPIGYFEQLENQVIKRINSQKRTRKVRSLLVKVVAPIAVAASLLFIFILNPNSNKDITFESLAFSEIEEFIEAGAVNIEVNTLASSFPDLELDTDNMFEDFSDVEVLDYLNSENLQEYYYDN